MKQRMKFSTKALTLGLGLLALLILAACSQESEEDMTVRVMAVPATVTDVTLEVTDSNGVTNTYPAVKNAEGVAEVTVPSVPLGSATLVAKGSNADGVVLYKGTQDISVIADMPVVSLLMSRLSSTLNATALSSEAMDAAEIVTATVGGAMQRLIMDNKNSASGTLVGVATGSNLTVSAQSKLADGTVVRTGSTSGVTVGEAGGSTTVVLNAVPADTQPPEVSAINLPADAPKVGVPFTVIVDATDPDGDLDTITLDWGDGSDPASADASSGSASFTYTYSAPGTVTISATAFDEESSNSLAESVTVTVESADSIGDDDSDVPVEIDVGDELGQVDLTVTNVPADTDRVQAAISSDALTGTFTAELTPTAAGWFGKLELPRNAQYSVVITTNPGESDTDSTTASFTLGGDATTDVTLDFGASDGGAGGGGDDNNAPTVSAGGNAAITLPTNTYTLNGSASDDGLPAGSTLTTTWSGPASVTFNDASSLSATATFSGAGTYTLTLSATDGAETSNDSVVITVNPETVSNQAPSVDAGDNDTITLPGTATLDGDVSDDDGDDVTALWSQQSGPGTVSFGDAAAVDTTASFSAAGTYVLELSADDGTSSVSDTVQIAVNPEPASATLAIAPVSDTCDGVALGDDCEITIALQNYEGIFIGFQFDFDFANGTYEVVSSDSKASGIAATFGTSSASSTAVLATDFPTTEITGSGEIYTLAVTKVAAGSDTFTTSEVLLSGAGNTPVPNVAGGSLDLD